MEEERVPPSWGPSILRLASITSLILSGIFSSGIITGGAISEIYRSPYGILGIILFFLGVFGLIVSIVWR